MRTPAEIVLVALLVLVGVGLAAAQPFRITFHRERDEPSSIVLAGEVVNDGPRDVVDVWVTAEAENARGQVVGTSMAFVRTFLPGHGTTAFTIKLLPVEEARSFRLVVSSFRYASASGVESP
jgi:hypothetical protein